MCNSVTPVSVLRGVAALPLYVVTGLLRAVNYITHPDTLADKIDPAICFVAGHTFDEAESYTKTHGPDKGKTFVYCDRCYEDLEVE